MVFLLFNNTLSAEQLSYRFVIVLRFLTPFLNALCEKKTKIFICMHIFLYVTLLCWLRMYVTLLVSSVRHLRSMLNLNKHILCIFLAVSGFEESNV